MKKYLLLECSNHIVHKYSLQFLGCFRDRLTQNLLSSGRHNFIHMVSEFGEFGDSADADVDHLLREGVCAYDYMDNTVKCDEKICGRGQRSPAV